MHTLKKKPEETHPRYRHTEVQPIAFGGAACSTPLHCLVPRVKEMGVTASIIRSPFNSGEFPASSLCPVEVAFIAIFMIGIFMEAGVYLKADVVQSLLSDFEVHSNESTKFAYLVLNHDHTGAAVMAIGFFMFLVSLFTFIYGLNGGEKRLYNVSRPSLVLSCLLCRRACWHDAVTSERLWVMDTVLVAEPTDRCLPLPITRLCPGVSLSLSPGAAEARRGASDVSSGNYGGATAAELEGKRCSAISMVVLTSEAIALAVFFSDPYELTTSLMEALQYSLGQYEFEAEINYIWSRIMWAKLECSGRFYGVCCGMNNFTDFNVEDNRFPGACCQSNGDRCTIEEVQTANRPGCGDKLFACTAAHSKHIMSITFATLLLLVSYIPLYIVSSNNNRTGEQKVARNVFSTSQNAVMALPITHTFLSSLRQPEE
ncbi:unnamed protein product [Taenia asiatica]|uniref:Tetraspanin n=1 Tax=Taenia asiatica TaxID=60517 RepID=A0A0R3WEF4_TAEAS|nr:unnamed protein product [Taenia asiatica]